MKTKILTILLAASVAMGGPLYLIERNNVYINESPYENVRYINCTFINTKIWYSQPFMEVIFIKDSLYPRTKPPSYEHLEYLECDNHLRYMLTTNWEGFDTSKHILFKNVEFIKID